MAKCKYSYIENKKLGTHSFFARPVFGQTLTTDEILEEALDGKSIEPAVAKAAITFYMETVKREIKRGNRCQLGDNFLVVYPNLSLSVKDYEDKQTHQTVVATPEMLDSKNAISRVGCSVSSKFSKQFAQEVSWQKVDKTGAVVDEDDITQGNENVEDDDTQNNSNNNNEPPSGGNVGD